MSDLPNRQQSRSGAKLVELTFIVRPPGNPAGIRCFTNGERAEAELYAAENRTAVEPLPLVEADQSQHMLD